MAGQLQSVVQQDSPWSVPEVPGLSLWQCSMDSMAGLSVDAIHPDMPASAGQGRAIAKTDWTQKVSSINTENVLFLRKVTLSNSD